MNRGIEAIRSCNCILLSHIGEPEENSLRLVVAEAGPSSSPLTPSEISQHLPELKALLLSSGGRQLIHESGMRLFEIYWPTYIGYSVLNESFTPHNEHDQYEGRLFVRHSRSHYLDFIAKVTFASNEYPGPFVHWGVFCLNHIIDVVSVDEPQIVVKNDA